MTIEQIAGRQIKTITLDHVSSEEAGFQGAELEMKEEYGHMALMVVSVQEDSPLCKQGNRPEIIRAPKPCLSELFIVSGSVRIYGVAKECYYFKCG